MLDPYVGPYAGPSKIPVLSSRDKQRAAESQAGLFDLEYLYELKKGCKKDVIDWCMEMNRIAKEYVEQDDTEREAASVAEGEVGNQNDDETKEMMEAKVAAEKIEEDLDRKKR
ncbi:hypothetical protein AVEN_135265-1 [Araneus ventricosus]|uniref:Uncharacterized protein n=1 Tax=Araneus ventricosus TaxID=182803 RepID=A0A4Y2CQ51_ARAVE|nr:hypothetical protein AVEN_135265-1 [Araneus ventricosus]